MYMRTPEGNLINLSGIATIRLVAFNRDAPTYEIHAESLGFNAATSIFEGTREECEAVLAQIARAVDLPPSLDLTCIKFEGKL